MIEESIGLDLKENQDIRYLIFTVPAQSNHLEKYVAVLWSEECLRRSTFWTATSYGSNWDLQQSAFSSTVVILGRWEYLSI